eukprot:m.63278 g.63278  ORF g.63278 m.63278 type:complete len:301 (-) comp13965_c0_seq1:290-1192(-)
MSSRAALVVAVVDLSSRWQTLDLNTAMDHLIVFLNAHLALNAENQVAVLATSASQTHYIYPKTRTVPSAAERVSMPEACNHLQAIIKEGISNIAEQGVSSARTRLAPALSKALCYCNKHTRTQQQGDTSIAKVDTARVFVLSTSQEASDEHVPAMNAAFAAKKQGVLVDVCSLGVRNSLLEQTADLTGGRHRLVNDTSDLLQHLLCTFTGDATTRASLQDGGTKTVNYQATCHCHGKSVSQGLVCSVCLSIFCQPKVACPACRTVFAKLKKTKKKAGKRAVEKGSNASSKKASRAGSPRA